MYKILTFGLGRKPISIERTYETLEEALQSAVTWWGEIGRSRGEPGPPPLWLRHDGDRTTLTPVGPSADPDAEQAIEIWDPKSHRCPSCYEPIGIPRHPWFYAPGSEGECSACGAAVKRFSEVMLSPPQAVFEGVDRTAAARDRDAFATLIHTVSVAWTGSQTHPWPAGPICSFTARPFRRGRSLPYLRATVTLGADLLDQIEPGWAARLDLDAGPSVLEQLRCRDDLPLDPRQCGLLPPDPASVFRDYPLSEGGGEDYDTQKWRDFTRAAWREEVATRR